MGRQIGAKEGFVGGTHGHRPPIGEVVNVEAVMAPIENHRNCLGTNSDFLRIWDAVGHQNQCCCDMILVDNERVSQRDTVRVEAKLEWDLIG